jgi:alpha-L-rhamnosidase
MTLCSPSIVRTSRLVFTILAGFLPCIALTAARSNGAVSAGTGPSVDGLRCEYLKDPLGIDVEHPRLSWKLRPAPGVQGQSACRVVVASTSANLEKDQGDLWDSGRVNSNQSTWVEYAGKPLPSGIFAHWKVQVWDQSGRQSRWSAPAHWSMGLLRSSDWYGRWIGEERPAGVAEGVPLPCPWLRKTVTLSSKPVRAMACVNPLGYYELYINGKKVDDHVLSPAVSDYSRRNLYVTHDVTGYLSAGKNTVAIWLGRGWYVRRHPGVIHDGPLVRAQIDAAMPDGSVARIGTDSTWKLKESPISPIGRGTAFGDYGGERFDAKLDLPGWNAVDLDDSGWKAAAVFEPPAALTAAQMVEPNRIMETIPAVKVESFPRGGYVIDMGKAFTGWLELRIPAVLPGTTVKLEYSDEIRRVWPQKRAAAEDDDSESDTRRKIAFPSSYNQRDEIISAGAPLVFRSRFNYHGFRFVRVTGLDAAPVPRDATGYLIHTAYEPAGDFSCSDDLMNRIYRMMTWTYRSLTLGGYVVDCPTRERLGYGGDAGTSLETGMLNFTSGGLYNRWLANWRDAQQPETGSLPHTAPNYQDQGGGGPMWGNFVVVAPWQMYLQFGDRRVLETNYPMIRKWLGYLKSETAGNIVVDHKSHAMSLQEWNFLGDWLTPKGSYRGTDKDPGPTQLINTLHYLYSVRIAAKIAAVLGRNDDATAYAALADAVSRAIHDRFWDPSARRYSNGDSVLQAFPLFTGVVPAELQPAVMKGLEETIRVRNAGHLDTGMHGTYFLLKFLGEADRNDLIYDMVSKKDFPGWGYMLEQGATTSWEDWDGRNSHIHDTLISAGAWFIQGIGGIRVDEKAPGFSHFVIKPSPVGNLTFARAKYDSIRGEISSEWRIRNGALKLDVTVPPGTTATVLVPGIGTVNRTSGPGGANSAPAENGRASFEALPGKTTFESKLRR